MLAAPVPIAVQNAFAALDHDMSRGSDLLFVIDGATVQCAAEVWAAWRIFTGRIARLTMFHHARALYEAHALMAWLLDDYNGRGDRIVKETLRERLEFEKAMERIDWHQPSDATDLGHTLLNDPAVKALPTTYQQTEGDPVLRYDYPLFWKHSSAHVHPYHIHAGELDVENEQMLMNQLLAGIIRHAAGAYLRIVSYFRLDLPKGEMDALSGAADWGRYRFALPSKDAQTN
jgi:hypothetical protein